MPSLFLVGARAPLTPTAAKSPGPSSPQKLPPEATGPPSAPPEVAGLGVSPSVVGTAALGAAVGVPTAALAVAVGFEAGTVVAAAAVQAPTAPTRRSAATRCRAVRNMWSLQLVRVAMGVTECVDGSARRGPSSGWAKPTVATSAKESTSAVCPAGGTRQAEPGRRNPAAGPLLPRVGRRGLGLHQAEHVDRVGQTAVEDAAGTVEQVEQFGIADPIDDRGAAPLGDDDAAAAQNGELLRDRRFGRADGLREPAHAARSTAQDLQDQDAHRMAEGLEELGLELAQT